MSLFKRLAMLVLSFSIAFAGFPAQAMMQCPMAKMQQKQMSMSDMKIDDYAGMQKTQEQQPKKKGCCDDMACKMKCMSMCSAGGLFLPSVFAVPRLSIVEKHFLVTDRVLFSNLPSSQERPPKFLS